MSGSDSKGSAEAPRKIGGNTKRPHAQETIGIIVDEGVSGRAGGRSE